jgi:hypothetical protein
MDRDYRGIEMCAAIAKEIVEGDKYDIDNCDVMLVKYSESVGTSMEMMYGYMHHKEIVLVAPPQWVISPWSIYHASSIYDTLSEACFDLESRKT